jgi:predicted acyltransferase
MGRLSISTIHNFHKTKKGYLVFALIEVALAYIFASIAIDTASMWAYLAAIIFAIGALLNFLNLFAEPDNSRRKKAKVSKSKDDGRQD